MAGANILCVRAFSSLDVSSPTKEPQLTHRVDAFHLGLGGELLLLRHVAGLVQVTDEPLLVSLVLETRLMLFP